MARKTILRKAGLASHVAYAPYGKLFKTRIENYIRHHFEQEGYQEMEAPLISRPEIWKKSGHIDRFNELTIKANSGNLQSLEKFLEKLELTDSTINTNALLKDMVACRQVIEEYNGKQSDELEKIYLPNDRSIPWCHERNMMMVTRSGHHENSTAILRPETATNTYQYFEKLHALAPGSKSIKVSQIGKSFRNEINTRNSLLRSREFTQAEFQNIILDPELLNSCEESESHLQATFMNMRDMTFNLFKSFNIPEDKLRLRQHSKDGLIFYAKDAWDIEVNLQEHGWTEIAGIHHRGTYDLRNSNITLKPVILEVAIGIDRLLYALVDTLMSWKNPSEGKNILNIPYQVSPVQVSVLPLLTNRSELIEKALEVKRIISKNFVTDFQTSGSIGKRYLRNGVRGIPYSITIDYESLENDDVTLRDRDTEEQIRVPVQRLSMELAIRFMNQ